MGAVTLRALNKAFGSVKILHDVNIDIADGEFVALVGPSGCGKSTLLRIIAGLEDATSGEIEISERPVDRLSPRDRNIAMVFQSYALYPHMNVAQNMSFNLKLAGKPKAEIDAAVAEAARMLDLTSLLDRKPGELSGGQRQRVAMGRAVVRQPDVFLFDEPLSNLDAKLRVQMRTEIKALHQKLQTTSIYVTHDQIEAMTLADRIIVLNKGRIVQQGAPMELYRRPSDIFVATFIGSPAMNLVEAVVERTAEGTVARLAGGTCLNLPQAHVADGHEISVGIRPEALVLGSDENRIDLTVDLIEPTGALTHVSLISRDMSLNAVVDGATEMTTGMPISFGVPTPQIHVFDRQSGLRLNID